MRLLTGTSGNHLLKLSTRDNDKEFDAAFRSNVIKILKK